MQTNDAIKNTEYLNMKQKNDALDSEKKLLNEQLNLYVNKLNQMTSEVIARRFVIFL